MKTLGGWLVMVVLGAGAGCVSSFPFTGKAEPPPPPVPVAVKPAMPAVLVTAEQVNKANAREMADSLRKELDLEAQ